MIFSSAQIIGIAVCVVASIGIALVVARLDSAIGVNPEAEEELQEAQPSAFSAPTHTHSSPSLVDKRLSRRQRKGRSRA